MSASKFRFLVIVALSPPRKVISSLRCYDHPNIYPFPVRYFLESSLTKLTRYARYHLPPDLIAGPLIIQVRIAPIPDSPCAYHVMHNTFVTSFPRRIPNAQLLRLSPSRSLSLSPDWCVSITYPPDPRNLVRRTTESSLSALPQRCLSDRVIVYCCALWPNSTTTWRLVAVLNLIHFRDIIRWLPALRSLVGTRSKWSASHLITFRIKYLWRNEL